jgi:hypothetical protein
MKPSLDVYLLSEYSFVLRKCHVWKSEILRRIKLLQFYSCALSNLDVNIFHGYFLLEINFNIFRLYLKTAIIANTTNKELSEGTN